MKLFFSLFRYRDCSTSYLSILFCLVECFVFLKDNMGQRTIQIQEGYETGGSSVGILPM